MSESITYQVLNSIPKRAFIPGRMSNDIADDSRRRSDSFNFFLELVAKDVISEDSLYEAYSSYFKIPLLNSEKRFPESTMVSLLPEDVCREHKLVPIRSAKQDSILLAISNPFDKKGLDLAKFIVDRRLIVRLSPRCDVQKAIKFLFETEKNMGNDRTAVGNPVLDFINITDDEEEEEPKLIEEMVGGPIVKLLNTTLVDAISKRASDIHIEPKDKRLSIRYRIDGDLILKMELSKKIHPPLIGRVKILSNLDIASHFVPQDGKIDFKYENRLVNLRISILPTIYGEKCVIRVLDSASIQLNLHDLGFRGNTLTNFTEVLQNRQGIILVTGPTGSGKTTTLYAAINHIMEKRKNINITTVEDPVEYELEGINQVQVNNKQKINFASALRSILRQDPDVILIGEIRDLETAEIAVQASQTGHLVLSTLHTNDAVLAVTRLRELGIDMSLLRYSLVGIIAQRLLKKICPYCKRLAKPGELPENLVRRARAYNPQIQFWVGEGCEKCNNNGTKGRIAALEFLPFNVDIRKAMMEDDEDLIRTAAHIAGMKTLAEAGMELVAEGITELISTVDIVNFPVV